MGQTGNAATAWAAHNVETLYFLPLRACCRVVPAAVQAAQAVLADPE